VITLTLGVISMWIVQFNGAKSGKRTNIYGPFSCAANAHAYGLMWMEDDEAFEVVYLCTPQGKL
jgi:hypothetical protein